MRQRLISLVVLWVLLSAIRAWAEEPSTPRRRVAVLGFKNLRTDPDTDWVGAVTAETLTTKLAGLRPLIVIERDQIRKVIEEQRLQQTDLVDPSTVVKLGRILGAESVVVGSFAVAGRQARFNVRIVDVETGEVLHGATFGDSGAQWPGLARELKAVNSLIESGDYEKAKARCLVLLDSFGEAPDTKWYLQMKQKNLEYMLQTRNDIFKAIGEGKVNIPIARVSARFPSVGDVVQADERGLLANKYPLRRGFKKQWSDLTRDELMAFYECALAQVYASQSAAEKPIPAYTSHLLLAFFLAEGKPGPDHLESAKTEAALARAAGLSDATTEEIGQYIELTKKMLTGQAWEREQEQDLMGIPVRLADAVIESLSKKVVIAGGERRVAEALPPPTLSEKEKERLAARPTSSAEAYEAYGRGVDLYRKHRWREAQIEFERAIQLDSNLAEAWVLLGQVCEDQGGWTRSLSCYTTAQMLWQAKGDEKGLAGTLNDVANVYNGQGHYAEAMKYYEESLAITRRLGDEPGVAATLGGMGIVHCSQGRYDEAMKLYQESLAMERRLGDEPGVAGTLNNIAIVHESQGRYDQAMKLYEESLAMKRRIGDEPGVAGTLNNIGELHYQQGRYDQAMKLYEECLAMKRALGDEPGVATTLGNMGIVHKSQGRYEQAIKLYEEVLGMMRRLGDEPGVATTLFNMAHVWAKQQEYNKALPLAQEAKEIAHRLGLPFAQRCDKLVADLEQKIRQ